MRKTILYSLLAWALSVPALALTVPDGKAAIVDAVIGKARVDQGEGYKAVKLGEELAPGSTIKTGANGRVALTLTDGSTARIASNTELTLKDETVRQGIFTKLLKGTVRFLVMKQSGGRSFETEMPNAVAAVKGTDPEYHTDGTVSTATVFSSGNPVALILTDVKTGQEQPLKAGEKLSFDGTSFKVEPITDEDTKESDKRYKGLPVTIEDDSKKKEAASEAQPSAATTPSTTGSSDTDKDTADALKEVTDAAIKEATRDLYLDGFLTRDERTGDIAAGKLIYDRFGQQVQVSHFITEPDNKTVQISSYSSRDAGPNKGVTSAIETSQWNKALPDNWGKIFASKLNDPSNLDGSGYPQYWKTGETFVAANPYGDNLKIVTNFDDPAWDYDQEAVPGVTDAGALFQGLAQSLYVNTLPVFSYSAVGGDQTGTLAYGRYITGDWSTAVSAYQGGTSFNYTGYTSNEILTEYVHLLDDQGDLLTPSFNPSLPQDFKGLDANVELTFASPLFQGRTIDLMFLPGFFDLYDILALPSTHNCSTC